MKTTLIIIEIGFIKILKSSIYSNLLLFNAVTLSKKKL